MVKSWMFRLTLNSINSQFLVLNIIHSYFFIFFKFSAQQVVAQQAAGFKCGAIPGDCPRRLPSHLFVVLVTWFHRTQQRALRLRHQGCAESQDITFGLRVWGFGFTSEWQLQEGRSRTKCPVVGIAGILCMVQAQEIF